MMLLNTQARYKDFTQREHETKPKFVCVSQTGLDIFVIFRKNIHFDAFSIRFRTFVDSFEKTNR